LHALSDSNWTELCKIAWSELWDMHSLFHTSEPPFFYFKPGTLAILEKVERLWQSQGYGPLATIDAGPNVHLLLRPEDESTYAPIIQNWAHELDAKLFISQ
jgi:diphosphomevalonate decarboxylase